MPCPLPYFQFHHRDWLSSGTVQEMGLAAKAIYHHLLICQWEDGDLPESSSRLRARCGASEDEWAGFEPFLEDLFPIDVDGRRRNKRMAADRAGVLESIEAAKEAGKKGGRPPKPSPNPMVSENMDSENPPLSETKPSPNPGVSKTKPTLSEKGVFENPPLTHTDTDRELELNLSLSAQAGADADDWWEDHDDPLVRKVAETLVAFPLPRGQTATPPDRDWCEEFVADARKSAIHLCSDAEQAISLMLSSFTEHAAEKAPGLTGKGPKARLRTWLSSESLRWREPEKRHSKPSGVDARRARRREALGL